MNPAKQQYDSEGFYLSPSPIIPTDVVQRAVAGMDAVRAGNYDTGVAPEPSPWKPSDDPRTLCKIEMPQVANRAIYELVTHPTLGKLAAEITGARMVQVWWVQLLYKPSSGKDKKLATNVGWHQDRSYWGEWENDSEVFTAWVALSNVTADSGPMRFVRGSHRWGMLNASDFFGQDHHAQREKMKLPSNAKWEEISAVIPAGGVSFHDDLTIHGSGQNLSGQPRRSFAIHLRTEKANPKDPSQLDPKMFNKTCFLKDARYNPVIFEM